MPTIPSNGDDSVWRRPTPSTPPPVEDRSGSRPVPDGLGDGRGTQLLPDAPIGDGSGTKGVIGGPIADGSGTNVIPNEPDKSTSTRIVAAGPVSEPSSTRFVPDGPDDSTSTRIVAAGPVSEPSSTRFVPDAPVADPSSTRFAPEGPVADPSSTRFVPDGPVVDPSSTRFVPDGPAADPSSTRFVPDGPVADPSSTRFVPDGPAADPSSTRFVPDGPARDASGLRALIARYDVDLPTFGRFRADALLGVGAMGTVYRAHDDVLGRDVAIKALRASSEVGVRERFLREARAVGAILHPNILAIYDAATHAGTPYLVMELATDGSLRDRIQEGPLEPDRVRELGIQIAQALAAAHGKSILHRDIKPANILATQQGIATGQSLATEQSLAAEQGRPNAAKQGRPNAAKQGSANAAKQGAWKLADFGIARMPDSTMTVDGQFVGSPSYAAPESLRAGQFSPASDVYGLAATLYEAVTGVPPHGDHDMTSVVKKLDQDPPPVSARRAGVPAPIADAIMRGLARDPAHRPSAKDLAVLLARTDVDRAPAGPSRGLKLLAAAFATAALVMLALVARSKWPAQSTKPAESNEVATPTERVPAHSTDGDVAREDLNGAAPFAKAPNAGSLEGALPQVVDEDGNPVDDETAKRILEQMERDAHEESERWNRPKKKKRGRDRWIAPDPWAPREY